MQSRLAEGRIPRFGPMLMLVARPAFILLAQGLTYLLFLLLDVERCSGHPQLVAGLRHTRRRRLPGTVILADPTGRPPATGPDRLRYQGERPIFPLGSGFSCWIFPVTIFGGGALAQWIAYGKLNPEFPEFHRNHAVFSRSGAGASWRAH